MKIPAGVADGQKIRLRGRGRPSPDGGEGGDIVVQIAVRPHPVFLRDGLNLRVVVPVTFTEATSVRPSRFRRSAAMWSSSASRRVPPPDGCSASRDAVSRARRAPAICSLQVAVPTHLDEAARAALQKFQELEPEENPRAELMAKARR